MIAINKDNDCVVIYCLVVLRIGIYVWYIRVLYVYQCILSPAIQAPSIAYHEVIQVLLTFYVF